MNGRRIARWFATLFVVALFTGIAVAQDREPAARALLAKYAGSYDTDAFLREPALRAELEKLLEPALAHLERNLRVRGSVDLSGSTLSVSGNAPHQGTEEEAIVCFVPIDGRVESAIYSRGTVTVYARTPVYEYLTLCIKDWITLVNSNHLDRFKQPQNVRLAQPR
ncbi:MAG TPA: hypothetical protein VGA88_05085 [Burkholderiales bacterium]